MLVVKRPNGMGAIGVGLGLERLFSVYDSSSHSGLTPS